MQIPKPIGPGSTVALIGISGCIRAEDVTACVDKAVTKLTALGFRVKVDPTVYAHWGYLSGTDQERADAMNRAFADDRVDGVWCIKGGWGCLRLMDRIDWEMIAQHPKAFIGYSDITSMHTALHERCGLCTFHGPMAYTDTFDEASAASLMHALGGQPDPELSNLAGTALMTLRGGVAEGVLVGGNLSLIASAVGTPYDLDTTGKLLFLEDVGEYTYQMDRYLQQLYLAGKLTRCAGVILGAYTRCDVEHPGWGFTMDEVIGDLCAKLNVPVVSGLQAGHIPVKLTLPLGRTYRLDADQGRIALVK